MQLNYVETVLCTSGRYRKYAAHSCMPGCHYLVYSSSKVGSFTRRCPLLLDLAPCCTTLVIMVAGEQHRRKIGAMKA